MKVPAVSIGQDLGCQVKLPVQDAISVKARSRSYISSHRPADGTIQEESESWGKEGESGKSNILKKSIYFPPGVSSKLGPSSQPQAYF